MAYDLTIQAGSTFQQTFRWEDSSIAFRDIAGIALAAPATITTVEPHGLTDGWRVAIVGAKGLTQLNALNAPPKAKDYFTILAPDASTLTIPGVNTKNLGNYQSPTGTLQFAPSVDLTGYTAVMQARTNVTDADPALMSIGTATGEILIDPTAQTIVITLTAAATAALAFPGATALYSLEMTSSAGQVTQLLSGSITVLPELTRA